MQRFQSTLETSHGSYDYYSIQSFVEGGLPFTLKILLENLLRNHPNNGVTLDQIKALGNWTNSATSEEEIPFIPARVLMQDFTGVPAIVDLAAMRDAVKLLKGNPDKINPLVPVDLVIDHSVQVDSYGGGGSFKKNVEMEFERNKERYEFLKWGQKAFDNFRVVPPGTGICHQVNLEYLGKVVWVEERGGKNIVYPDTLVGTDSHTTMINGLSILGWGVGGIEAEAAMLGQPISMLIPEVIGFRLDGSLKEGVTATDLVLTVTQMLRAKGVVGKFVEFYGKGLDYLSLADRATIANMSPEFGATCAFFPTDQETLNYLSFTGRPKELIELVEKYAKVQGLWRDAHTKDPVFTDTLELNLQDVKPCIAGPKRPQDRILLSDAKEKFSKDIRDLFKVDGNLTEKFKVNKEEFDLSHGHIVIAAITSCTNTSNPALMVASGLIAKKAAEIGIAAKPWVKTSFAPGSQVVSEYLEKADLQKYLDKIGFNLVGYGCTTCIGNSGPLKESIAETISKNHLVVASVLSGNRNFEGRIHPLTRANYLASPPLVVLYALAGTMNIDITTEPICQDKHGNDVFLQDLWPSSDEVNDYLNKFISPQMFKEKYKDVFSGEEEWQKLHTSNDKTYKWDEKNTYINNPPYFTDMHIKADAMADIKGANILAVFGDSITTDHISPAGSIANNSPAARYLESQNIDHADFNSYGSRRGNHEVMMRGTFANIRIKNEMLGDIEGGLTIHIPSGEKMSIYDAAMKYKKSNTPLVIIAGKEYGSGSSRDWAAKGPNLLGVRAVIAESFERIHRSNLIGMGIIPLVFKYGVTRNDLRIRGDETIDIIELDKLEPKSDIKCIIHYPHNQKRELILESMIYTESELKYLQDGGILQFMVRKML